MRINVKVTKSHISHGKKLRAQGCPIYLALEKTSANVSGVGGNAIFFYGGAHRFLPARAKSFIDKFDCGEKVKPFSFILNIPKNLSKNKRKP